MLSLFATYYCCSIMVAAKFFDDQYYNNAYYAKVGGVPCGELNSLETEFLFGVNFGLSVTADEFYKYRTQLVNHTASGTCGCSCIVIPTHISSSWQFVKYEAPLYSTNAGLSHLSSTVDMSTQHLMQQQQQQQQQQLLPSQQQQSQLYQHQPYPVSHHTCRAADDANIIHTQYSHTSHHNHHHGVVDDSIHRHVTTHTSSCNGMISVSSDTAVSYSNSAGAAAVTYNGYDTGRLPGCYG
jgi:Cyclin